MGLVRLGPHGRLDPTFGGAREVVTDFGPGFDEAYGVAVQANGKLLVAGSVRPRNEGRHRGHPIQARGCHDETFGAGGRALTDVGGGADPPERS